jgi:hypothetical protein
MAMKKCAMPFVLDKEKCMEDARNRLEEALESCKPKPPSPPSCQEEANQKYEDAK